MLDGDLVIGPVETVGVNQDEIEHQEQQLRELVDWYSMSLAAERTAAALEATDEVAQELRDARWLFRRRSLEALYTEFMGIHPSEREEVVAMVKQSLAAGGKKTVAQIKALLGDGKNNQSHGSLVLGSA